MKFLRCIFFVLYLSFLWILPIPTNLLGEAFPVKAMRWNPVRDLIAWTDGYQLRLYDSHFEMMDEIQFFDSTNPNVRISRTNLVWSPNGNKLAVTFGGEIITAPSDNLIQIWDINHKEKLSEILDVDSTLMPTWNPNSDRLIVPMLGHNVYDTTLRMFQSDSGMELRDLSVIPAQSTQYLVWSPDRHSSELALILSDGLQTWNIAEAQLSTTLINATATADYNDSGSQMAFANGRSIEIWQLKPLSRVRIFQGHGRTISKIRWENNTIASIGLDNTVRVWNVDTGQPKSIINILTIDIDLSPDGIQLLVFDVANPPTVYDATTGAILARLDTSSLNHNP